MKLRSLLIIAAMSLIAIAPAEAKKLKTPKSPNANANVKQATHKAKKYKPSKYKAQHLSKKPPKSAHIKYGTKAK